MTNKYKKKKQKIMFLLATFFLFFIQHKSFAIKNRNVTRAYVLETKSTEELNSADKLEQDNKRFLYLDSFSKALNIIENQYVEKDSAKPEILLEKAIKGMLSDLDPHTTYLTPSQLENISNETSGKFGGIGVVVGSSKNKLQVVEIIEGSPAQKTGLSVGDVIHSIDDIQVNENNTEKLISKIRGTIGSKINIEYYTPGKNNEVTELKKISITRELIKSSNLEMYALSDSYAYIKLELFYENASEEIAAKIKEFKEKNNKKISGLILDLRNNPGGLLDEAVKVTNLFIDSGIIVSTIGRDKTKPEDVEYALKKNTLEYFPMIILVNEGTASASEIVAGALQDRERALIIGTKTFGKGSVQNIVPLPNKGAIKLTIARYYTPNGRSIQVKGITPDIPLISQNIISKNQADQKPKREEDLKKHIVGEDQETSVLQKMDSYQEIAGWSPKIKNDYQVKSAYIYLKNFGKIQNMGKKNNSL